MPVSASPAASAVAAMALKSPVTELPGLGELDADAGQKVHGWPRVGSSRMATKRRAAQKCTVVDVLPLRRVGSDRSWCAAGMRIGRGAGADAGPGETERPERGDAHSPRSAAVRSRAVLHGARAGRRRIAELRIGDLRAYVDFSREQMLAPVGTCRAANAAPTAAAPVGRFPTRLGRQLNPVGERGATAAVVGRGYQIPLALPGPA